MINDIIIAVGLIAAVLLFWKLPKLRLPDHAGVLPQISVIIPMRNEESNIALLLSDLCQQNFLASEIICVDDESADSSAQMAAAHGAKVISVGSKPKDWVGKSFACQTGAQNARYGVLLFLDADVRLAPDALSALAAAQAAAGGIVSVQPYHRVNAFYEYFSLFANIVQIASTGIGLPFQVRTVAFFGPVLAVPRETYLELGGHTAVKGQILEDLMLARHYARNHVPSCLFTGGDLISFRMYSGGLTELWQGWTKNMFSGASSIPVSLLVMVVFMIGAYSTVISVCISALVHGGGMQIAIAILMYILSAIQINIIGRQIGSFHPLGAVFYPVFLTGFIILFVASAIKKLVLKKTKWKGRDIPL